MNHCTTAAFDFILGKISREEASRIEAELDKNGFTKVLCICGVKWSCQGALNVKNNMIDNDKNISYQMGNFKVTCPECIAIFKKAGL